jgi:hypothetical protein
MLLINNADVDNVSLGFFVVLMLIDHPFIITIIINTDIDIESVFSICFIDVDTESIFSTLLIDVDIKSTCSTFLIDVDTKSTCSSF